MARSRAPMAQSLPGFRPSFAHTDTTSITGLLPGPGPVGEVGRSEHDSVAEDAQSVDGHDAPSSPAGDLGSQVIVTA